MFHNSSDWMEKLWLALAVLVGFTTGASAARGDYLIFTGETWDRSPIHGTVPTPSGIDFDIDTERLQLIGLGIEDKDLLIFDLSAGTFEVQSGVSPAELLDEDPFFQIFSRDIEVRRYTEAQIRFVEGPTNEEMEAVGALTWVGEVTAPPGAGGGGGGDPPPPTDTDGDGVPDTSDNCPFVANANQADNDLDSLGDACDPDDDNDGLSDVDEIGIYGTDPFLVDTDGDGFSDFDEVNGGTDPLDPASFPMPAVPALEVTALVILSFVLMSIGYLRRGGHLGRRRRDSH